MFSVAKRALVASVTAAVLCAPAIEASAAQRVITGNDSGLTAEAIDSQRLVRLEIRKAAPNYFDDVPAGALPPAPISGARFLLYKVEGIDVKTTEGRNAAKSMTEKQARENGLTLIGAKATDSAGKVVFEGLEPGLYLIEEEEPEGGEFDYRLSNPQLVILPLGSITGTSFEYDNVIVRKNGADTPPTEETPPPPTTTVPAPPTTETTPVPEPEPSGSVTPTPEKDKPGKGRTDSPLAETGANVIGFMIAGAALMACGLVLLRRKREENE